MRMSRALLMVLVVPLAVVAAADKEPPAGFKEVTPKNKSWVAWYPSDGKIDESEDSIVSRQFGQIRIFRTVLDRKDKSAFIVSLVRLPAALLKAPAKDRQDFFKEILCDEFNATVKEEKNIRLGTMAGKEFHLEGRRNLAIRARVYGTGTQVFRVLVVGTKEQVNSKDAETFFDSFKRTPKTGENDKKSKKK